MRKSKSKFKQIFKKTKYLDTYLDNLYAKQTFFLAYYLIFKLKIDKAMSSYPRQDYSINFQL